MRGLLTSSLAIVYLGSLPLSKGYTWPDSRIDRLEDIFFVQSGLRRSGFLDGVNPCSFGFFDPGRQNAAEWVRTAFHDMITHNAASGAGGLDASIMFETNRPENIGIAFNGTLGFLSSFYSIRAPMADLIAMGAHTALRTCRGPSLPIRIGRIDATGPGPEGVPEPQDELVDIARQFADAGFTTEDMIEMTACGHTLGGVHGVDFPDITGDNSTSSFAHFDSTFSSFDNKVVTEYLDGTTTNLLVVGPDTTTSDLRIFSADGNTTMNNLSNPTTFANRCKDILTQMIDTVPSSVTLSEPLSPIPIKPVDVQLTLNADGTIAFKGNIRVLLTGRNDQTPVVRLRFADRFGSVPVDESNVVETTVPTFQGGIGLGFDYSFKFYEFSTLLNAMTGISHFNVSVTGGDGDELHTNSGNGFPIQDSIMFQKPQSCLIQQPDADGRWNLTIVSAVRAEHINPATLTVIEKLPRNGVLVPALRPKDIAMSKWTEVPGWVLQTVTYKIVPEQSSITFDVAVLTGGEEQERIADEFKNSGLEGACAPFA